MAITLLNPKAIAFCMAFFPLFVVPARHQGFLTLAFMAARIAMLTNALNCVAGTLLIGFGIKLALSRRSAKGRVAPAHAVAP